MKDIKNSSINEWDNDKYPISITKAASKKEGYVIYQITGKNFQGIEVDVYRRYNEFY